MHHRDAELHRGVVEHVAHGEVVGAVDHDVVVADDAFHVGGIQAHIVGDDVDVGVEQRQRLLRGVDLALTDPVDVVQDLALQVRLVDHVHVDDADRADTGRSQVQRGRRSQTAGAEQQDTGAEQLLLALLAHLGQQQVTAVPVALLGGQDLGAAPVAAFVLPLVEPADHGDHVAVPQLAEGLGGEGGPHAAGAHHDDGGGLVGQATLDLGLEVPTRDEHRVRNGALLELVGLAHVQQHDTAPTQLLRCCGVDLTDLGLGGVQESAEIAHRGASTGADGGVVGKCYLYGQLFDSRRYSGAGSVPVGYF